MLLVPLTVKLPVTARLPPTDVLPVQVEVPATERLLPDGSETVPVPALAEIESTLIVLIRLLHFR